MRWRSLLYVPVTQPRFVAKAHTRGADGIQLDLEDGVAADRKDEARALLPSAVDQLAAHGVDVVVRVNRPWRLLVRDLEVAVRPGVRAIALPKVPDAGHVRACAEVVTSVETEAGLEPGSVGFVAMVETAGGLLRAAEIAAASPRVRALALGTEDLAIDLGVAPDPEPLLLAKQTAVVAARAAGVLPLGLAGTIAAYDDEEAFGALVRRSRALGFVGASAIHPRQVPVLNEGFAPSAEEVAHARRVVDAFRAALARGEGAVSVDGAMVDEPVARRAEQLLALASE